MCRRGIALNWRLTHTSDVSEKPRSERIDGRATSANQRLRPSMSCFMPTLLLLGFSGYHDHPRYPETVRDHAEARRKECLRKRHLYLAAFGERVKKAVGLRDIRRAER